MFAEGVVGMPASEYRFVAICNSCRARTAVTLSDEQPDAYCPCGKAEVHWGGPRPLVTKGYEVQPSSGPVDD